MPTPINKPDSEVAKTKMAYRSLDIFSKSTPTRDW